LGPRRSFRGVFAYPVTPTRGVGDEVDEARLRSLIEELVKDGSHGIVVLGSTGAIGSFSDEERRRLAEIAVAQVSGRVPVLVGTGHFTTADTIKMSVHAEKIGADGVQIVPLSHWPLTSRELMQHYAEVASAISIPIVVHNCPSLTGMDMRPEFLAELSAIPNVRYLKEGSGDQSRIPALRRLTKGAVTLFQDQEVTALQGLIAGAEVWASMMPNVVARQSVEFFDLAVVRKDLDKSRALFEKMFPLIEFVTQRSGVRALHTALELLGRPVGPPRRPMRMLEQDDRAKLERILRDCELM
jgi:4-hydroxy-tetrahydrodipicolinate synthase